KDITARALEQSPNDPRILDLRRDAAEKIVTEALGLKYAGDRDGALRLSKLALEFHPALTTAQHLVAELEAQVVAEAPAATTTAVPADAKATDRPASSGKSAQSKSTAGKPSLPGTATLPPPKGTASTVAPAKTSKPS